jgi:glycosyltransferase involved in cell wall biosynthesis
LLIDAWAQVAPRHPDWVLRIYGDGGLRSDLQAQVDRLDITETCRLEPTSSDIAEKYADSSIFVLSSRYEGFGMVLTEAMACGLPVVSFDCPCGPKDIIRDREDGLLVANGNIQELAASIEYMITHDGERKQMAKQALVNVQRFQMEEVSQAWMRLFKTLTHK